MGLYGGSTRSLGLTLSQTDIEAVTLRPLPGRRWQLESWQRVDLPENTIDREGRIENPEALMEALRTIYPEPARFGPPVNVSFDGPQVLVRGNSLKDIPWANQQEYVMGQIRRYPNFNQGELAVGYHAISMINEAGERDQVESEVLVVATRQELVDSLREILRRIGLNMGMGTSRALAAFGVPLRADIALTERNELWLAVTMVPAKLVISLWRGVHFLFYREIPLVKEGLSGSGDLFQMIPSVETTRARKRGQAPFVPQDDLIAELISEIKRSLGFYQVVDLASVPVYLLDFQRAGLLCEQIRLREPALQVFPYQLQGLTALELGDQQPSAAVLGTAMMDSSVHSVVDLSFIQPHRGYGYLMGIVPGSIAAGVLSLAIITIAVLLVRWLVIDPRLQEVQSVDDTLVSQLQLVEQKARDLSKVLPPEESRRNIQLTLERNHRLFEVLAVLLDKDLPRVVPENTWLDGLTLEEHNKVNITGRSLDPQAVIELTHRLKRLPYLASVRLLVIERVQGTHVFRYRVTGTFAPPGASQG